MYLIQIIDDDVISLFSTQKMLNKGGFTVRSASDGATGLTMIREKCPDLILCDIMMPNMDGYSVLKSLLGDPVTCQIPFIFMTAMSEHADIRRGMTAGADDYLVKPFPIKELIDAVNGRIARHKRLIKMSQSALFQKEQVTLLQNSTVRERAVLQLIGQGRTTKEISKQLGICVRTTEVHRTNMMKNLGATNAASLARWSIIAEQVVVKK